MPTTPLPFLDASQLYRYTKGDARLQVEVLSLFAAEAERLLRQIEDASDGAMRLERLRGLIGLARNIGATHVVQEGRALEAQIGAPDADLSALRGALAETLAYVRRAGV